MSAMKSSMVVAAMVALAGTAMAAPERWTGLFSNIAGSPTANVPGNPGLTFEPNPTSSTQLDRIFASPGGRWAIIAEVTDGVISEESLIVGDGASLELLVRGGVPSPWNAGEAPILFNDRIGINDAGSVAFVVNTDGPIGADEIVVSFDGLGYTVEAREGEPIGLGPELYGLNMHSATVLADGRVGFVAESITFSAFDAAFYLDGTQLIAAGEPIPNAADNYDNFDDDFTIFTNSGGFITQGDSDAAANDDFVIRDGVVVLREGEVIPGSSFVDPIDTFGIVAIAGSSGGDWMARGNNDVTEQDWIVVNGAVVVQDGDEVPGSGGTEFFSSATFSDTFFTMAINNNGDYLYGGTTDAFDLGANAVVVHSTAGVIAREGDPIDLDGNGQFDDDAFFDVFGNEDAALTDDGEAFLVVRARTGGGSSLGQVLVWFQIPSVACSPGDISSPANPGEPDGLLSGADFFEFLVRFQSGDLSVDFSSPSAPGQGDGLLSGADFFEFLNLFAAGC